MSEDVQNEHTTESVALAIADVEAARKAARETAEREDLARKTAVLDAMVARMPPGVLPHFHPFSRAAKRIGLTKAQYEAWAETVPHWDATVVPAHSNAYASDA